ncbi:MAG: hypothetical protein KDA91_14200 [Planctomycetaceae bacterium]|nr:hypothetical protein [Planctomycetaceae bacterium]
MVSPDGSEAAHNVPAALAWKQTRAALARRFFPATAMQATAGAGLALLLVWWNGKPVPSNRLTLPAAFQFGTAALVCGSWMLHMAVYHVRLERQEPFRRSLLCAMGFATVFVGVQSYGLWAFAAGVNDFRQTQTNVHGFVFMFTALHAMHFLVAQSVLLWVTLCAYADCYDHEYNWGVVFAAWCWHALGLVWLAILCVFAIATD